MDILLGELSYMMSKEELAQNDFLCSICRCVLDLPYQINCECKAVYCKRCIEALEQKICPICRATFKEKLLPANEFIQKLGKLTVRCPARLQNGADCLITRPREQLKEHLQKAHDITRTCSNRKRGCMWLGSDTDFPEHLSSCTFMERETVASKCVYKKLK